ncbi:MAG: anhydro-N-acetylmuramic acid kinase [Panacagrimonas sp.]
MLKRERYLGLMSGTSQDGIDAVLAEFVDGCYQRVLAAHSASYSAELRTELIDLSREATPVSLSRLATLDVHVADAFADAAQALIRESGIERESISAIGSHGQTVFHDAVGAQSSLQLGDPSRIAVRTGLPVVADFRRADVALGGQGAPLLPVLHHALFAHADEPRAVLNLGGIANLSLLPNLDPDLVRGFDTGPASCLMDEWIERHQGVRFDVDGSWAACGALDGALLRRWLADPWFQLDPPKSTGRGQFHLAWIEQRTPDLAQRAAADVQSALCELTAATVADALSAHASATRRLLVCGGGIRNRFLMSRLRARLPGLAIESTADHGLDPQWVEATAFAWLACRRLRGEPGNLPSVTGARRHAVLGGIYSP